MERPSFPLPEGRSDYSLHLSHIDWNPRSRGGIHVQISAFVEEGGMAMAASASLRPDSLLRRHLCTTERSPVTRGYRFMSLLSVDRGYVERREDEHTLRVFT